MRIIKKGKDAQKEIEMICERCGCVFAYEAKDVNFGHNAGDTYIICPHCKQPIEVKPFPIW